MLTKRGIAAGQLVVIILVIIGFLLIASVTYGFTKTAEKKSPELLCHDTIAFKASTTLNVGTTETALSSPICETIDREITGDREEIKSQLAEMMSRCWWMFNEGRYEEILNDPLSIKNFYNFAGDNECFVCYNVLINEKDIKGGEIPLQGMDKYLRETKTKKYAGISYLDYIQSYGGPGSVFVLDSVKPREGYGIVFMAKNKRGDGSSWFDYVNIFLATSGAIISPGIALGAQIIETLKAKKEFYDSDERDVSVIVLDSLKSVNYNDCDRSLFNKG